MELKVAKWQFETFLIIKESIYLFKHLMVVWGGLSTVPPGAGCYHANNLNKLYAQHMLVLGGDKR